MIEEVSLEERLREEERKKKKEELGMFDRSEIDTKLLKNLFSCKECYKDRVFDKKV